MPALELANGVVGGLLATVLMIFTIAFLDDEIPPLSAVFLAAFAGGDPVDHKRAALALHFLYGAAGGAAIAVAFVFAEIPPTAPAYLVTCVIFGALLSIWDVFGRLALRSDTGLRVFGVLLSSYLVYAVVLAGWLSLNLI